MAKFRIETAPYTELPLRVQSQLRRLTLALEHPGMAASSGMNYMQRYFKSHFDCWVAFDEDEAIGWSLRTHTTVGEGRGYEWDEPCEGEMMTYVHPDYRRMGIGTDLVTAIEDAHGEGIMFQWDERSTGFYEEVLPKWENGFANSGF